MRLAVVAPTCPVSGRWDYRPVSSKQDGKLELSPTRAAVPGASNAAAGLAATSPAGPIRATVDDRLTASGRMHRVTGTIHAVLDQLRSTALDERDKGDKFER